MITVAAFKKEDILQPLINSAYGMVAALTNSQARSRYAPFGTILRFLH